MALTTADFKTRFPEFNGTPDATVQAKLDEAYRNTPADVWEDLEDDGAGYLTAHLLALLPQARDMRVGKEKTETLYMQRREYLERVVASGFRVTGSD